MKLYMILVTAVLSLGAAPVESTGSLELPPVSAVTTQLPTTFVPPQAARIISLVIGQTVFCSIGRRNTCLTAVPRNPAVATSVVNNGPWWAGFNVTAVARGYTTIDWTGAGGLASRVYVHVN